MTLFFHDQTSGSKLTNFLIFCLPDMMNRIPNVIVMQMTWQGFQNYAPSDSQSAGGFLETF